MILGVPIVAALQIASAVFTGVGVVIAVGWLLVALVLTLTRQRGDQRRDDE